MEDVMAGLSSSKANYKVTLSSVTNPGERSAVSANPTHTHWDPQRGRDTHLELVVLLFTESRLKGPYYTTTFSCALVTSQVGVPTLMYDG